VCMCAYRDINLLTDSYGMYAGESFLQYL